MSKDSKLHAVKIDISKLAGMALQGSTIMMSVQRQQSKSMQTYHHKCAALLNQTNLQSNHKLQLQQQASQH